MKPTLQLVALVLLSGVCLAQGPAPIYRSKSYAVFRDRVTEGVHSARALSPTEIESDYPMEDSGKQPRRWKLTLDVSKYPQLHSDLPLVDATYNLSLEEMKKDIRPDGAFRAGAEWGGVWTRDISYSILLSLAAIEPDAAKVSLMRKVKRDRIVQDTGTGGSWPVSTDRVAWILAAWEVYAVTGDRDWLLRIYTIARNSLADDESVVLSAATSLAHGESSFLDHREQTYPRWMEPADIYSAQALGTNALFFRAYRILAQMARSLHQPSEEFDQMAERIRNSMNRWLWIEDKGYYGQYRYGRISMSLSPRSEALGESLAILFDVADPVRQDKMLSSVPVLEYGIPCVFPQTPGVIPYHNRAIWPFVQAFWNLAAAKRHNGTALLHGLAAGYRMPALFLTNKENMVADSGSPDGTDGNSERQLWSVAGSLAMTYRILFGMTFEEEGLRIGPVIPKELDGVRTLTNFHYRGAVLSFRIEGHGAQVQSIALDGKPWAGLIPGDLIGEHKIMVVMAGDDLPAPSLNLVANVTAPGTPTATFKGQHLHWDVVPGAADYLVYRDGELAAKTRATSFYVPKRRGLRDYQVSAADARGFQSFLSEPVVQGAVPIRVSPMEVTQPGTISNDRPQPAGFVDISRTANPNASFKVVLRMAGRYRIQFRYANGSGGVSGDNKCAIRSLFVDGKRIGPIVLPQRGEDDWSNWGMSSTLEAPLSSGSHKVELRFEAVDENMNPDVNRALIEALYLLPVRNTADTGKCCVDALTK